jgi:hypothetical protein
MFGPAGSGDDSSQTSGLCKPEKSRDRMDKEMGKSAHDSSYSRQKPLIFQRN